MATGHKKTLSQERVSEIPLTRGEQYETNTNTR
jgi:hypothetical protein